MTTERQAITVAYAGLVAAGNAIVSKFGKRRNPGFNRVPPGFEPPTVEDMLRLLKPNLDGEEEELEQRMARITACSILQSLEATKLSGDDPYYLKPEGNACRLVSQEELARLTKRSKANGKLADALAKRSAKGTSKLLAKKRKIRASELRANVCRYCSTLQELLYPEPTPTPIVVLDHSARIESDFDPVTNIAEAKIADFQLLVPARVAMLALQRSHPLLWEKTAKDMFKVSRPAKRSSGEESFASWGYDKGKVDINAWSKTAFAGEAARGARSRRAAADPVGYLYERAVRPWNEHVSVTVENVFRITDFANITVDAVQVARMAGPSGAESNTRRAAPTIEGHLRDIVKICRKAGASAAGGQGRGAGKLFEINEIEEGEGNEPKPPEPPLPNKASVLSYGYELESCIESDFGLGAKNGGLDIDDGRFDGSAIHYTQISDDLVRRLQPDDLVHLIVGLMRRNGGKRLDELLSRADALATTSPPQTSASSAPAKGRRASGPADSEKVAIVKEVAKVLKAAWQDEDPWLLTISASKRLKYTYPRDGQTDLWSLLTWMSPAFLFTFINRSVCQLPYFLKPDERSVAAPKRPRTKPAAKESTTHGLSKQERAQPQKQQGRAQKETARRKQQQSGKQRRTA